MTKIMRMRLQLAAGLLLLLAGCGQTPPTQFYTLSGLQVPPGGVSAPKTVVGIGPVVLPDYLDRPQVVTRASGNRMMLADFSSWVEPIDGMFTRILAQNLSLLLATDDVITLPLRRQTRLDYQIEVDVSRFDADATGRALLDARWKVFGQGGEALIEEGRSTIVEPVAKPGNYEAIVAAMSKALGEMSRTIASAIEADRSG